MTKHLTTMKAAKYCGVHPETILRAFRKGDLKGFRRNQRVIRFTKKQLDDWMEGK